MGYYLIIPFGVVVVELGFPLLFSVFHHVKLRAQWLEISKRY